MLLMRMQCQFTDILFNVTSYVPWQYSPIKQLKAITNIEFLFLNVVLFPINFLKNLSDFQKDKTSNFHFN